MSLIAVLATVYCDALLLSLQVGMDRTDIYLTLP